MLWTQHQITLPAFSRGFHLITSAVVNALPDLGKIEVGLLNAFIQHTSASLTINENADPDVRVDLETAFSLITPEDLPFIHTIEGPDDMPAHVKSSILGCSLTVPISSGRLCLGTWQGIYLCEHRDRASPRRITLTAFGQPIEAR